MTTRTLSTPLHLAALTALGGAVSMVALVGLGVFRGSTSALFACAAFALGGAALVYYGPYVLRDGVANERWSFEDLQRLRRIVAHPAWMALCCLSFVVMMASLLAQGSRRYFWPMFLLLQALTQLSTALRGRPQDEGFAPQFDWRKVPPLHSDHWGER